MAPFGRKTSSPAKREPSSGVGTQEVFSLGQWVVAWVSLVGLIGLMVFFVYGVNVLLERRSSQSNSDIAATSPLSQLTPALSPQEGQAFSIPGADEAQLSAVGQLTRPSLGCMIKGKVNLGTNEKIYYVPGQKNYVVTDIDPTSGDRWFCSEQDAQANGFKKSPV